MTERMVLAALLALTAIPALAADTASDRQASTSSAGQIGAQSKVATAPVRVPGRVEAEALNADPTWPRTEAVAPAVVVRSFDADAVTGAIVNDEPMASALREKATARLAAK